MVKAVAENNGVDMPSFVGYIVWAAKYLIPSLAAMMLVFIVQATWATFAGFALALAILAHSAYVARAGSPETRDIEHGTPTP